MNLRDARPRATGIRGGSAFARSAAAAGMLLPLALVGLPLTFVAMSLLGWSGAETTEPSSGAWLLLVRTIGWSGAVGVLATILAVPAACVLRARGWGLAPLLLVPLTLPTYLVYSALNLARAPGTRLGDWIELAAQRGSKGLPLLVGEALTLIGLSLWAWPLAAIVMASRWRLIDQTVLDALRLERGGPFRRAAEVFRLGRSGVLGGVGVVALVMMGSAVPLHLAQVRTFALEVWSRLALFPGDIGVWTTAWPPVVAALLAAVFLARSATTPTEVAVSTARPVGFGVIAGAAVVWALSTVAPLALFALSVESASSFGTFWRYASGTIVGSVAVAVTVGAAGVLIAAGAWVALSESPGGVGKAAARAALFLWLIGGLLPGVLVGSALLSLCRAVPILRDVPDSPAVLIAGHLARYGCVPALVGVWLAVSEPVEQAHMRRLDGATGLAGWWRAIGSSQPGLLAGAGVACGCLSLHEIEASVILQPPGTPSLAQTLLGYLHFSKTEEMSVAAVMLVGASLLVATGAALAASRSIESGRRSVAAGRSAR